MGWRSDALSFGLELRDDFVAPPCDAFFDARSCARVVVLEGGRVLFVMIIYGGFVEAIV